MNLPDLATALCEQLGAFGFSESKNVATLDAILGTLRIAYRQGEHKATTWRKEPPAIPGYYWQRFFNAKGIALMTMVSDPEIYADAQCEWSGPIQEPKDAQ